MKALKVIRTTVKKCPWEKIPWAFDKIGRFYTTDIKENDNVLLLCDDDKVLTYLIYRTWMDACIVEIPYVHTRLDHQNKGYSTLLMNKVLEEYGRQCEIHTYATSGIAESLLKKSNFKRLGTERSSKWVHAKTQE